MGKRRKTSSNNVKYNKHKYIPVYSKNNYEKDEQNFNEGVKSGNFDWTGFKRLFLHDISVNTNIIENGYIGEIKIEDVQFALKHPKNNWKTLLSISEELMRVSPHYFRLNNLYSNMALFCWGIDLYDIKENVNINTVKKMYNILASKLESMSLKHEFSKIAKILPYQDIYCGLTIENQVDFFIQQIPYRICKIFKIQDGLYNFSINLSGINPKNLNAYPDYVQQAYIDFTENILREDINGFWYTPPADKQICIKFNSQWIYPYPMLINLVGDILDLNIYKKLKLQSARTDNYKAIMMKVPIDDTTIDKPLLTPETLSIFAEINRDSMNDDIGLLYTLGSDGEAISFKDSSNTRNNVSDAVNELYNSSGLSKELFNGSSSGTAVTMSIENDSGFIYGIYRQFERWINRFIKLRKYNKSTYKFHFYLLDITIFNRDSVTQRYKDACTLGMTVIDKWVASLDMTPSRLLGSYVTHNEIFDFQNNFIPLSSSFNSSEKEKGRPTNKSKGKNLDIAGEQTDDSDANMDR